MRMSNGLDVALMKDPYGEWSPEDGDHHLEIPFSDPQWGSFFLDTLKAELRSNIECEPYEESEKRRIALFQQSLKEYPLLSRIHHFYQDACFAANEIVSLENELKRVEKLSLDNDAKAFLDGMLLACNTARSENMGIRLLSS